VKKATETAWHGWVGSFAGFVWHVILLLLSNIYALLKENRVWSMKKPLPEAVRKRLFVESVLSMAGSNN